jgi:hypothetical protein
MLRVVKPLPVQHEVRLLVERALGIGVGVDEEVRFGFIPAAGLLLGDRPVPLSPEARERVNDMLLDRISAYSVKPDDA